MLNDDVTLNLDADADANLDFLTPTIFFRKKIRFFFFRFFIIFGRFSRS